MHRKVIVIGMLDSVHLGRWLSHFTREPISFFLLASSPHRRIHPSIRELLRTSGTAEFKTFRPIWLFGAPLWIADRIFRNRIRAFLLGHLVRTLQPDAVHALELQNAGYIALAHFEGKQLTKSKPKLIITNYGSDIYWFERFPRHRSKILKLLSIADAYSCECLRDVNLAREAGFEGQYLPVFPNAGGYSAQALERPAFEADRQSIAIKGYQGWVGRAKVALSAVNLIAPQLHGLRIEVYSCNRATIRLARRIKRKTGLQVTWSPKGSLSHQQVMELFRRSKVYIGISESDGISTSLLEAMASGAIPVQTSTACCDEWFTDTGVRVDTIAPEAVAEAILAALELAKDPSNAERNRQTIREKASEEKVKAAALQYYR